MTSGGVAASNAATLAAAALRRGRLAGLALIAPALAIVFFATSVTIIGDWVYDRFSYSGRTGR